MQNENSVSAKLDRIDSALNIIRTKTDTTEDIIEDVATAVENLVIPSGSLTVTENDSYNVEAYASLNVRVPSTPILNPNIYKVTSIQEMEDLENVQEGALCVVYTQVDEPLDPADSFNKVFLPDSFTLSEHLDSSYSTYAHDSEDEVSLTFDIDEYSLNINYSYYDSYTTIMYDSSGSLTYTKMSEESELELAKDVTLAGDYYAFLSNFLRHKGPVFSGIFTYSDGSWIHTDIGIKTTPASLFNPKKGFTNDGVITGTLGAESNDIVFSFTDMQSIKSGANNKVITGSLYDALSSAKLAQPDVDPTDRAFTDSHPVNLKDINTATGKSAVSVAIPELDCSNVTQITEYEMDYNNLTYGWFSCNKHLINLSYLGGFKNLGKSFTSQTSENQFKNIIPLGLIYSLNGWSLVNLVDDLYDISSEDFTAGFQMDINLYERLNDLGLISKIQNKGWKIYRIHVNTDGYHTENLVEWVPTYYNTIIDAENAIINNGDTNNDTVLDGLTFDSSITSQTLTIPNNKIAFNSLNTTKYLPGFTYASGVAPKITGATCGVFGSCQCLERIGTITLDPTATTILNNFFRGCTHLKEAPTFVNLDGSNVTTMQGIFTGCHALTSYPTQFTNLNSSANLYGAFKDCVGLKSVPALNLPNIQCTHFFLGCSNLELVTSVSIANQNYFNAFFANCTKLKDVGSCNFGQSTTKSGVRASNIISNCPNLTPTSIVNILSGIPVSKLENKSLSYTGLTKIQWESLSSAQQESLTTLGYTNDFE